MPAAGAKPCRIRCRKKKRDLDARRSEWSTCSVVPCCNLPHHRSPAGVPTGRRICRPPRLRCLNERERKRKRWVLAQEGKGGRSVLDVGRGRVVCWAGPSRAPRRAGPVAR
jgi:hypothetical protein